MSRQGEAAGAAWRPRVGALREPRHDALSGPRAAARRGELGAAGRRRGRARGVPANRPRRRCSTAPRSRRPEPPRCSASGPRSPRSGPPLSGRAGRCSGSSRTTPRTARRPCFPRKRAHCALASPGPRQPSSVPDFVVGIPVAVAQSTSYPGPRPQDPVRPLSLAGRKPMKTVYAPGCALMLYKPDLAERVMQ